MNKIRLDLKKGYKNYKFNSTTSLYLVLSLALVFLMIFAFLISKGQSIKYLVWHIDSPGIFPDFFETVRDASVTNPYNHGAVYPALVYLLLSLLSGRNEGKWGEWWNVSLSYQGIVLGLVLIIFSWTFFSYFASEKLNLNRKQTLAFSIIYLLSPGFVYGMERGNLVVLVNIFVLLFVLNYSSTNQLKKELALISLAIAAGFKIYPALLGLLLLNERDWKGAIRCIIYGVCAFFLPFIIRYGVDQIPHFIQNIFQQTQKIGNDVGGWGYGFKISISSVANAVLEYLHFEGSIRVTLSRMANVFLVVVAFTAYLCSNKKWQKCFSVISIMTLLPGFSWMFTAVYFFVAIVLFLSEETIITKTNGMYVVFMSLLSVGFPNGEVMHALPGKQPPTISTLLAVIIPVCMMICFIIQGIYECKMTSVKKEMIC